MPPSFIQPYKPTALTIVERFTTGRMHNYTPEELLLFLYKELSPEQSMAIEEELKTSWALREKLSVIKTAMERLDNLTISPRTEAVLNVLRYAQKETVSTTAKS